MQQPIRSQSILISFLVAICLSASVHAIVVPWTTSNSNPSHQLATEQQQQPSFKSHSVYPQWTYIRDIVIETLFRLPPKASTSKLDKLTSPTSTSKLPGNLLAKYGGEIVLRFNLTTPEEERALAEAANTLFLDVWEFTNNWADIRLREDDVRVNLLFSRDCAHENLGSLPPRPAANIATQGILESDARSSQDDIPILPLNCFRAAGDPIQPYGKGFHPGFEGKGCKNQRRW